MTRIRIERLCVLLLLTFGCENGENERDIAQLRAEYVELSDEVARLRAMVEAPPLAEDGQQLDEAAVDLEWRRVDLPAANIELPGTPKRRVLTLEEWRAETGAKSDSSESFLAVGTTGSVLEYTYSDASGVELRLAEIAIRGGIRSSLDEHIDRLRAKLLRADPVAILEERPGRSGRFRTLDFQLELGGGRYARVIGAVGPARKRQSAESADIVIYLVRATWSGSEHAPLVAQRFLGSFELD